MLDWDTGNVITRSDSAAENTVRDHVYDKKKRIVETTISHINRIQAFRINEDLVFIKILIPYFLRVIYQEKFISVLCLTGV